MPGSHLGSARAVTQRTALGADRHSFETLSFSAAFVPALKFGPVLHLYSFLLCQQTLCFVRCPHHHAPRQMARAAPRLHGGRAVVSETPIYQGHFGWFQVLQLPSQRFLISLFLLAWGCTGCRQKMGRNPGNWRDPSFTSAPNPSGCRCEAPLDVLGKVVISASCLPLENAATGNSALKSPRNLVHHRDYREKCCSSCTLPALEALVTFHLCC